VTQPFIRPPYSEERSRGRTTMPRQLVVARVIAAGIGVIIVGGVIYRFMPHKTEAPVQPAPPSMEKKQAQQEKQSQEDKQAQRWVCSHTTRRSVTIMTEASGALQAYMDQCDEWKLK
jgi:hypothetical protein